MTHPTMPPDRSVSAATTWIDAARPTVSAASRVGYSGTQALQRGAGQPRRMVRHANGQPDAAGLDEQAPRDQPLAAHAWEILFTD
jgi:hypothetical protein